MAETQPFGIGAKALEEAQKLTESTYIELMDKMEASVPENEEFFVLQGEKAAAYPKLEDTRVLVLIKGRKSSDGVEGNVDHIAITRKGPRIITMDQTVQNNMLTLPKSKDESGKGGFSYGTSTIRLNTGDVFTPKEITSAEDKEFMEESISESIRLAKETGQTAKNKVALKAQQQKLTQAKELSALFDKFTQPPTSPGPTI